MIREERREVSSSRHRSDPRSAATVGDAERLVKVEMADVGPELARQGHADQRIQVGAVDVDLTARLVHHAATPFGPLAGPLRSLAEQIPASAGAISRLAHDFGALHAEAILATLEQNRGHRQKSARALGIGVRTLGMKLKRWKEAHLVPVGT